MTRTVVTPNEAVGIDEIFARATRAFSERRFQDAARDFDRVTELDPDGEFAERAWFDAGAAHDMAGAFDVAASRFQEAARRYPRGAWTTEALVRAVRLLLYREQWASAGDAADRLLGDAPRLAPLSQVVAYSGKALALLARDETDSAEYFIAKGRDVIDAERLDAAGAVPRDLAQLFFALGELRRARGERIRFDPVPPKFAEVLEARCQSLLDAQSAYSDAMRAYDAHWSTMAGYRVGELYQVLHADLMRVPPPKAVTTVADARLFEGAMRLRYEVLLRKGLAMMEHTLSMARREGERSDWVSRAEGSRRAMEDALRQEEAALAALPYTRRQLEAALERLRATKGTKHE